MKEAKGAGIERCSGGRGNAAFVGDETVGKGEGSLKER